MTFQHSTTSSSEGLEGLSLLMLGMIAKWKSRIVMGFGVSALGAAIVPYLSASYSLQGAWHSNSFRVLSPSSWISPIICWMPSRDSAILPAW